MALGERVAPEGVTVDVVVEGDRVVARAGGRVPAPGGLFGFLPGAPVRAEAVAVSEEGSTP
ncbi:hypothetical protein [Nocardioides sp. TF02-7]|uniref:hypothetical protein n=1 Tax=Nocardioides sp. TF02-7 TaxID=2917724 RepID=UPI001F053E54|nr:hypothetical protein [Nocardioides sp. TF02-7]UMG95006.1 hypothetical protein MF408_08030 [Nocardioides sp. TF02-7]